MPHLARITIIPIKALDGFEVPEAQVFPSGALEHNRRYAIVDESGRFVNGKNEARVHLIRASYDLGAGTIDIGVEGNPERSTFYLKDDRPALEEWLSTFFGRPVVVVENTELGFPDDTDSPGPTIASEATLREVAGWFPGLSTEETRKRFRATLEIGDVEPFWEDRLFAGPDEVVQFRVGEVLFEGTYPCERCVVPTRTSTTGEPIPRFVDRFQQLREDQLPAWAHRERFQHFYRLAVNTRPARPERGTLRVGDPVEIVGTVSR